MWGQFTTAPDDVLSVPKLALPRSLDIAAVSGLSNELLHALSLGAVTLDAGAVVKLDAAGLQLLCAAVAHARTSGAKLEWTNVPAVLEDGARTLALTEALGWSGAPSQENR